MLKYRLIFGTLMTVFFTSVVILDGWLDGSLTISTSDDLSIKATFLCILVVLLIIPALLELSRLAAAKKVKVFTLLSIIGAILFASYRYWMQFIVIPSGLLLLFISAFVLLSLLLGQYLHHGTSGVIANCGASYFCIAYLGILSSFVLAVRIDYGLWSLLMFIFVVKFADIGAYAFGSMFGKHKFSPNISAGKTWEGMAGAVVTSSIVAVLFAISFDIMFWWLAVIFGICFAFIGQFGDLAESMMKRDAEQKDSAKKVPGFGGILDIIDSPLIAAPFAYLFFYFLANLHK